MRPVVGLILRHPLVIIVAFVALCAGAAFEHNRSGRYDFSFHTMAPTRTPEYSLWKKFVATFGQDNNIYMIALRVEPLLTNDNLAAIDRITQRIEMIAETESVTSLTNALDIRGTADGLEVTEFVPALPLSAAEIAGVGKTLTADPILAGNVISPDGTTTAIVGRMIEDADDPDTRLVYFAEIEAILAEEAGDRFEFHISGIPYMDRAILQHMLRDTAVFIPTVVVVLGGLLWLAFGHLRMVWMPLTPIGIAAVGTLGVISLVGLPMTLLTGQGFLTTLIVVIGLSDGVHLLNRYAEELAATGGRDRSLALARAMRHVGLACFLTSLTTAIGFGALAISDIPTIREFGMFGALGVALAYVGAVVFLPACIVVLDRFRPADPRPPRDTTALGRALSAVAALVAARPRAIVAIGVSVLAVALLGTFRLRVDNRFTEGLYHDDPALVAMRFIEDHLSGTYPLAIVVEGSEPDAIKSREVLEGMEFVRKGLEQMDYVTKVHSPAPFVMKMNRAMHADAAEAYAVPDTPDEIAQYLLLYEMAGSDGEFDRLVTYDYATARMSAFLRDIPPHEYEAVIARLHELVRGRFGSKVRVYESGGEPLFFTVTERLISTLIRSLYLAMPIAFLIVAVAFRSLRLGLLSILPNVLPLTIGLGLMGVADLSLRFTTIIAFPVAFGLAIDDTIHFIARYRSELTAGRTPEKAVHAAMISAGRAMVLTTAFLIAGYSVLLTSSFLGVAHMGIIVIVVLTAALFGDLLVLPALLLTFRKRETVAERAEAAAPLA